MSLSNSLRSVALAGVAVASFGVGGQAQEAGAPSAGRNMAEMKFEALPGMPTCARAAVQSGDPSKGPSILLAKIDTACTFPWHWHTPAEHLMIVGGAASVEMKDGKPVTLKAGGFAVMPTHHVHRFRCVEACSLFVYSDGPFDMHYVDAQGTEIAPEPALKAVGETAVTAGK